MGVGGTTMDDLPDEILAAEQQRLENQVKYNPAFTAQLDQIAELLPDVEKTIVRILFNKSKSK